MTTPLAQHRAREAQKAAPRLPPPRQRRDNSTLLNVTPFIQQNGRYPFFIRLYE